MLAADDIRARSDHGTLATVARVTFAHDWAAAQPRQALTLAAPDAITLYGRIETTLELPAVRTARDALAIASAILADRARPAWIVEAATVALEHRGAAIDPAAPDPGTVLYRDGTATFTITDDAGNPLAGAETRNTDRGGRVQFKTERGPHTLTVFLAGYAPFEMDVIV